MFCCGTLTIRSREIFDNTIRFARGFRTCQGGRRPSRHALLTLCTHDYVTYCTRTSWPLGDVIVHRGIFPCSRLQTFCNRVGARALTINKARARYSCSFQLKRRINAFLSCAISAASGMEIEASTARDGENLVKDCYYTIYGKGGVE